MTQPKTMHFKVQDLSITTFPIGCPPEGVTTKYILKLREDGTGYILFENEEDGKNFMQLPPEISSALTPPKGKYTGPSTVGKVYWGTVLNVLPGINSALIDIEEENPGYLELGDIDPKRNNQLKEGQQLSVRVVRNPKNNHGGVKLTEVF